MEERRKRPLTVSEIEAIRESLACYCPLNGVVDGAKHIAHIDDTLEFLKEEIRLIKEEIKLVKEEIAGLDYLRAEIKYIKEELSIMREKIAGLLKFQNTLEGSFRVWVLLIAIVPTIATISSLCLSIYVYAHSGGK